MTSETSKLFERFEALEIDPAAFGHREHVQVAFELLHHYGFLDACIRFVGTIRSMAKTAGAPEKVNLTITMAFLSLIAERIDKDRDMSFETFSADNPDVFSKHALDKWYSRQDLSSEFARTHFMLPRHAA